ncbi:MAG: apolipoprotein N-acyltransferase [Gammaproteobacteria bacterium]
MRRRERGSVPVMPRRMMSPWPTASAHGASHTAGGLAGDLGALASGAVLPLGFAPFDKIIDSNVGVLAILSLAVLFALWSGVSAGRAARRGWLYGLGAFGVGVSWVQISVHQFGLPHLTFSVSVTVAFVTILATYPAVVGFLANRLCPSPGAPRFLLALPALWCAGEWVRGWLFTGFPWLSLGYSQIDAPLGGLAPIFGVYGVGLGVALCAGLFCQILNGPRRPRYSGGLCLLLAGSWALGHVSWTRPAPEPLKVALIQGNIAQAIKWAPAERQATIDRYLALSASHWDKDLIVWPETAIPLFFDTAAPYVQTLRALAERHPTEILIGMPFAPGNAEDYFNAVVSVRHAGVYRKRHLVPFGEYMPLPGALLRVLDFLEIPLSDFSAGPRYQPLLEVAGHPIGISICYEDAFGEEVIDALPAAELLVNVSNDAWFGDSLAPHQHLQIARMRAREAGRYLLRATNTGVSAVIDERGRVLARSPQFQPHALSAQVVPHRGLTPYAAMGNYGVLGLTALFLVFLALGRGPPHPARLARDRRLDRSRFDAGPIFRSKRR